MRVTPEPLTLACTVSRLRICSSSTFTLDRCWPVHLLLHTPPLPALTPRRSCPPLPPVPISMSAAALLEYSVKLIGAVRGRGLIRGIDAGD